MVQPQLMQDVHGLLARVLEVHRHLGLELSPPHLRHFEGWRRYLCNENQKNDNVADGDAYIST